MKNKFEQAAENIVVKREAASEEYKDELARLAEQIMHEKYLKIVEELLDSGDAKDTQRARRLLLLTVDGLWYVGTLLDEEAQHFYKIIGFTPDEASQIRQEQVRG